jgi:hypothetical protein
MSMSLARRWSVVLLGVCGARAALAQDLTPRAYLITPVASNAIILSYSHLRGGLEFAGAVPITGAEANASLPIVAYYRSLDLFGRSANFTVALPVRLRRLPGHDSRCAKVLASHGLSGCGNALLREPYRRTGDAAG